jgi:hypothetical protein
MQSRSPPKHRHDGTSPLPLGMDWSPPPKKWVYSLLSFYVLSYSWKIIAESRNCGPSDEFDFDFFYFWLALYEFEFRDHPLQNLNLELIGYLFLLNFVI